MPGLGNRPQRIGFRPCGVHPALIFDLDGTLVDSLPGIAASLNHALAHCGLPTHPVPVVRHFIGNGSYQLARKAVPTDQPDAIARTVEAGFKEHYGIHWPNGTTLYPGIAGLIAELAQAGRRMAVLSNKPDGFTREIVRRLFPQHPFSMVCGQIDHSPRKPDPNSVLPILNVWSIPPTEARFIGDSTVDLATAAASGIPFMAVGWGYHDPAQLGQTVFKNAEDLRNALVFS